MNENELVDSLKKIEEIGIAEIARRTHIEPEYIKHIAEKNYEDLKTKNVRCFVKIIEREFDLNLQSWLDEYNSYNLDFSSKDNEPVFSNSVKQKEIIIKDNKKFPSFFIWLIILAALAFVVFKFELYNFEKYFSNSSNNNIYQNNATQAVEEVENKLENIGIVSNTNNENISSNLENETNLEENATELNALEKIINLENNLTSDLEEESSLEDNSTEMSEDNATLAENEPIDGASIIPTENIWIGIINLSNGKKTTLTAKDKYDLDTNTEQLILTGHGLFTLQKGAEKEVFKSKDPYRFHIKDGKVETISYDEFIKLNKGKPW